MKIKTSLKYLLPSILACYIIDKKIGDSIYLQSIFKKAHFTRKKSQVSTIFIRIFRQDIA